VSPSGYKPLLAQRWTQYVILTLVTKLHIPEDGSMNLNKIILDCQLSVENYRCFRDRLMCIVDPVHGEGDGP
jgi:hypothetical protein